MKYLYYPGCSLKGTARDYEESLMAVASALGLELQEVEGWRCCGASAAKEKDKKWAQSLPSATIKNRRNLEMDILMPCSSCYANHLQVVKELQEEGRREVPYHEGKAPRVKHLLEVLAVDLGEETIKQKVILPLQGLRVLPYYGCLVARPFPLGGKESMENPRALEMVIRATGAASLVFPGKLDCCGGLLLFTKERVALRLSARILKEAAKLAADCILVVCPLCHLMLDAKQRAARKESGGDFKIPVLYVTQLLGLALGLSPRELSLQRLITSPSPLLGKLKGETA